MTQQDVLNKVVAHMRKQQMLAMDGDTCAYRVPGSLNRCAIGALIPDDVYSPDMERQRVEDIITSDYPALMSIFDGVETDYLSALQRAHDMSRDYEEWIDRTRVVCTQYALIWPE